MPEFIDVPTALIQQLIDYAGKPITVVGTTSLRTVESLYWLGVKTILTPAITIPQHWWSTNGMPMNWKQMISPCRIRTDFPVAVHEKTRMGQDHYPNKTVHHPGLHHSDSKGTGNKFPPASINSYCYW